MKPKLYECIKQFSVPLVDEYECEIEGKEFVVQKGTIWEWDKKEDPSHLYEVDSGAWLSEINPAEDEKKYFREVPE